MKQKRYLKIILLISIIYSGMIFSDSLEAQVKIGVFADCQYCDCETAGNRYYRNSLTKLTDCIAEFNNTNDIDFVVGLGDLIDRDFTSFEKVNLILAKSVKKVYQVSGNHDYSVETEFIDSVPIQLQLENSYYSFEKNGWQFIFLNGNDITFQSTNPEVVARAKKMVTQLTEGKKPNNHDWNGGIGAEQKEWLKKQLEEAEKNSKKVVLFCHYPLLPFEAHALWNAEEILSVLQKYNCVKAWINGHNHAGNYAMQNGIHFITMQGMVDTEKENAYSVVSFSNDIIEVEGFGREVSRNLPVR